MFTISFSTVKKNFQAGMFCLEVTDLSCDTIIDDYTHVHVFSTHSKIFAIIYQIFAFKHCRCKINY